MDGSEDGECGEAGQQGKSQQARATHQPTSGRHQPTSIESKVCDLTSYIRTIHPSTVRDFKELISSILEYLQLFSNDYTTSVRLHQSYQFMQQAKEEACPAQLKDHIHHLKSIQCQYDAIAKDIQSSTNVTWGFHYPPECRSEYLRREKVFRRRLKLAWQSAQAKLNAMAQQPLNTEAIQACWDFD